MPLRLAEFQGRSRLLQWVREHSLLEMAVVVGLVVAV